MKCSHEVCMVMSRSVLFWGIFLNFKAAGRCRVALRESREARRDVLVPGLSPLGSLAMITLVVWMAIV
jgi:hypothetical protein